MNPNAFRAALCAVLATSLALQSSWALGPFEMNHPLVEKGAEAYSRENYSAALDAFDEARRQLPGNAAVDFDRGNTLYKMGRYEEARDAFLNAEKSSDPKLRQKTAYNLGNTYSQLKQREEAIRAYRKALRLDPKDADARHNLEMLLRNTPPPQSSDAGSDGGSSGDGGSDAGPRDGGETADGGQSGDWGGPQQSGDAGTSTDGGGNSARGADGGSVDAGDKPPDAGSQGGEASPDGGLDGGAKSEPDAGTAEAASLSDGGTPPGMSRDEALRLLDAMKQNEKNLQLWRFQQKRTRKNHDKDW
jgi:tetratricopeptide (TPR) repeat protein